MSALLPFLVGTLVLALDLSSKFFIQSSLPLMYNSFPEYPYGGIGVFSNFLGIEFSIVHATNRGAAWGIFADWQLGLLLLRILMILVLFGYALFFNRRRTLNFPLALIIAGATGNVIDYFLYGHVIDMFHFVLWHYDYPVFNIADTAIFIGIAWFIIDSLRQQDQTAKYSL